MIFSQPVFFVFLAVLLLLYSLCRSQSERAVTLLAGSLLFYASWKPAYLILLVLSVSANYLFYSALSRTRSRRTLVVALTLNLTLLGVIKYLGMVIDTALAAAGLAGVDIRGVDSSWTHWALPLGISFYTFHMLSVMIDVYRGEWTTRISFRAWWLYVSFFPHMVAGPILRASELVEQLGRLQPLQARDLKLGALIFMGGLIKKVLFADNLAGVADDLLAHPERLDSATAWLGVTAFALQIYFDFSGYSEMAIGLARVFGITLPRNFLYPYVSRNPQEFWQRWHITLSRWLRDYLYVSLGGNRRGAARTLANLMITMVLGGLWHGAAWTFVIWGALHGGWLVLHRVLKPLLPAPGAALPAALYAVCSWAVSMVIVWITWVFFRAPSLADLYTPVTTGVTTPGLNDPLRCPTTGNTPIDCQTQFNITNGGTATLKPEKSTSATLGFVAEPTGNVSIAVDAFKIDLTNTINNGVPANFILSTPALATQYGYLITRNPPSGSLPGSIANIDQTNVNLGGTKLSGFDFDFKLGVPSRIGRFTMSYTGTYFMKFDTQNPDGTWTPGVDQANTVNGGTTPRLKTYLMLNLTNGPWSYTLAQNWQTGYADAPGSVQNAQYPNGKPNQTSNLETYDGMIQYAGFKDLKLTLGVRDILNRKPPYANSPASFQTGYDPQVSDPRGRFVYGVVGYSFR